MTVSAVLRAQITVSRGGVARILMTSIVDQLLTGVGPPSFCMIPCIHAMPSEIPAAAALWVASKLNVRPPNDSCARCG